MRKLVLIAIVVSWLIVGLFWCQGYGHSKRVGQITFKPCDYHLLISYDGTYKQTYMRILCGCSWSTGAIFLSEDQRLQLIKFLKDGIRKLEQLKGEPTDFLKQKFAYMKEELGTIFANKAYLEITANAAYEEKKHKIWMRIHLIIYDLSLHGANSAYLDLDQAKRVMMMLIKAPNIR